MNFTISQTSLLSALRTVERAVTSKTTIPSLACVLMCTENGTLKVSATNLEFAVVNRTIASVTKDGAVAVPAKALVEYISTLSSGDIELVYSERTMKLRITQGNTKTEIKCLPADEFPKMAGNYEHITTLDGLKLKGLISGTIFCASKEDNRAQLNAVYITCDNTKITASAADGFRLATIAEFLDSPVDKPYTALIQSKSAIELARILGAGETHIYRGEGSFRAVFGDTEFSCQIVAGSYPDVSQLIPKVNPTKATLSTAELLRTLKQAEIFCRDETGIVRLDIQQERVCIKSSSKETGEYETEMSALIQGPCLSIAANSSYLREIVNALVGEHTVFEMNTKNSPILIGDGRKDVLYIVMPMQLE